MFQQKEDPTLWNELRSIEADYERRRFQRIQYYEAVKQAESISVEDIPLPSNNPPPSVGDIPLPSDDFVPAEPHSILKKSSSGTDLEPPGVPPGSPPELSSGEEDEEEETADAEKDKEKASDKPKKSVHFDDDLDQFMKEVEQEFKEKVAEEELQPPGVEKTITPASAAVIAPPAETDVPPPPGVMPPPSMMPPPMPPQIPQQPPPNRIHFYGQRPPPGYPGVRAPYPRMPPAVPNRQPFNYRARFKSNVYTSGPQLSQKEVITAKPQIRSLSADVTRFVPVAVKTHKSTTKDDAGE